MLRSFFVDIAAAVVVVVVEGVELVTCSISIVERLSYKTFQKWLLRARVHLPIENQGEEGKM